MALIAVSCPHEASSLAYAEALASFDVILRHLPAGQSSGLAPVALQDVQALLIGGSPDLEDDGDETQRAALWHALERDIPVLAVGAGMQLLNLALGGKLLDELPDHAPPAENLETVRHQVYVTPGSKLSAILGPGGFFRVNSWHRRGLREAQRAPTLMTSAYSLDDGVVEAVESPSHDWVIGVQFQPERTGEVPRSFANLFTCFVQRIEA